jgi:hypothetical protein
MLGIGLNPGLSYSAVTSPGCRCRGDVPQLDDVRYLVGGDPAPLWDAAPDGVLPLFGKEANLQSISAGFLHGPGRWIVLHMTADATKRINGPIIARIGTPPFDWSEAFALFDPCRERAYGRYLHWPGLDAIRVADPRRDPCSPPRIRPSRAGPMAPSSSIATRGGTPASENSTSTTCFPRLPLPSAAHAQTM